MSKSRAHANMAGAVAVALANSGGRLGSLASYSGPVTLGMERVPPPIPPAGRHRCEVCKNVMFEAEAKNIMREKADLNEAWLYGLLSGVGSVIVRRVMVYVLYAVKDVPGAAEQIVKLPPLNFAKN